MKPQAKIILTIIVLALIALVVYFVGSKKDTSTQNMSDTASEQLPEATGNPEDLFAAIDISTAQEEAYVAAETESAPADSMGGFDQAFTENEI